jgi:hypothetical protein
MKLNLCIPGNNKLLVSPKCMDAIVKALIADGALYHYCTYEKGEDGTYQNIWHIQPFNVQEHISVTVLDDQTIEAMRFVSAVSK